MDQTTPPADTGRISQSAEAGRTDSGAINRDRSGPRGTKAFLNER
jgi:hypothetical protein